MRDEDSKVRYNALHWPVRLKGIVDETLETLNEDEARYKDAMVQEQEEFTLIEVSCG